MLYKENNTRKSRELTFPEFFENLQLEFIVSELRFRIYPDGRRKEKSLEIMEGKKNKIKDIAIRNHMDTIFTDITLGEKVFYNERLFKKLYSKVYPEFGFPNFIYRDKVQENLLKEYDYDSYYKIGEEFITNDNQTGALVEIIDDEIVKLSVDKKVITVFTDSIRRNL